MNGQSKQGQPSSESSRSEGRNQPATPSRSSTTPKSRTPQLSSASQSSSPKSPTQQRSQKEDSCGNKTAGPDNNHPQQSESPNDIIPRDERAGAPRSPSSPQNRNGRPGRPRFFPGYWEKEARKREQEVEELKVELKRSQEKEHIKDHELSLVKEHHEETKRRLQSKIDELDTMQAFSKKADQISVAEVIDLVKRLNADILQAAAFISEPQHFSSPKDKASEPEIRLAQDTIQTKLGNEMASAFQNLRKLRRQLCPEDPTAVQFALQITMTRLCDKVVNAWTRNPDADKWINGVYDGIRASEGQTIAGRWRALTRAQADGPKDPVAIITHLIERLRMVLVAFGFKGHAEKFEKIFHKHLKSIAENVIRLQIAAGESITSADVTTYFYPPGQEFKIDHMDDMYSRRAKDIKEGPILGTTALGLWKKEKETDATGQSKDVYTPLLKAKVVFAASLRE